MSKGVRQWVWAPAKPSAAPDAIKQEVSAKGDRLVRDHLKPTYVEPPPKKPQFNYLVDIYTRWRGRFFYFMAKYANPGPNRIAPFFEIGFSRLEYAGKDRFHLAYFRHTGKWWQVHSNIALDKALELIKEGGIFQP
jgi:hypothetical protein